jgi:type IV pilus assembly protein PilB
MAYSFDSNDLGTMLLDSQLITTRQLNRAKEYAEKNSVNIKKALIALNFVNEKDITEVIGRQIGVEYFDIGGSSVNSELLKLVPEHLAQRHKVVPVEQRDNKLILAMVDPLDVLAIDDIRLITGYDIIPVISTEDAIVKAINREFGSTELQEVEETVKDISSTDFGGLEVEEGSEEEISVDKLKEMVDEAPIVKVVNLIISQAISDKASDIHIEPDVKKVRVRYRVDGVLHDVMSPPKHIQAPMVSRIKIMANMDIAERRIPQDGKIHIKRENREYDLRVSSLPIVHGEKIVMRILDKSAIQIGLDKLGFYPEYQKKLEEVLLKPYGMILVTGPTGSGKSTTLYSCLNKINTGSENIMTVEDPVEYQLSGVNQVQVNVKAGLTFASALRSFLRQDPDKIMVGEIRDGETARIAVEAALTGHMVLSTLHTNDAPGAITRLIDMGIEPFLVASSVVGVLAQRLARKICPNCKENYTPPAESVKKFGLTSFGDDLTFYRGFGCDNCKHTGYKGRGGIFELFTTTDKLRSLIIKNVSTAELRQTAITEGMQTLQEDGIKKVLEGVTSIEECLRVVFVEGEST